MKFWFHGERQYDVSAFVTHLQIKGAGCLISTPNVFSTWHGPKARAKRAGAATSVACECLRVARTRQARPLSTREHTEKTYGIGGTHDVR